MEMNISFLKSGEKKNLLAGLNEQFGIEDLNYTLIETGKNKIRGFSGTMTRDEIRELSEIANVEIIGCYLIRKEGQFRLGLDGSHILKNQIKKRIVDIENSQVNDWFLGKNLDVVIDSGVYVVRNGKDFLGCGISDGKKLINFVPKERRVRRS